MLGVVCVLLLRWRRRYPFPLAVVILAVGGLATAASGAVIVMTVSLATRRRWREIVPAMAVSIVATAFYFEIHDDSWDSRPASPAVRRRLRGRGHRHRDVRRRPPRPAGRPAGAGRPRRARAGAAGRSRHRSPSGRGSRARCTTYWPIGCRSSRCTRGRWSTAALSARTRWPRRRRSPGATRTSRSTSCTTSSGCCAQSGADAVAGASAAHARRPAVAGPGGARRPARRCGCTTRSSDLLAAPDAIGRSAYRVIQESLTNARKHAPDTAVDVTLEWSARASMLMARGAQPDPGRASG